MNDRRIAIADLPTSITYSARAIASRHKVMKNREGSSNRKLQTAIGRIMPHLGEDEVLIIIRPRDIPSPFKEEITPGFSQQYHNVFVGESNSVETGMLDFMSKESAAKFGNSYMVKRQERGSFGTISSRKFLDSIEE